MQSKNAVIMSKYIKNNKTSCLIIHSLGLTYKQESKNYLIISALPKHKIQNVSQKYN